VEKLSNQPKRFGTGVSAFLNVRDLESNSTKASFGQDSSSGTESRGQEGPGGSVPSPAPPPGAGEVAPAKPRAGEGPKGVSSFASDFGAEVEFRRFLSDVAFCSLENGCWNNFWALTGPRLRRGHLSRARGRRGRGYALTATSLLSSGLNPSASIIAQNSEYSFISMSFP
jgi:hypothetical protein